VSVLVLDGVVRRWGPRTVLAGVDLTLPPETLAWLGGPNGAGKTTLLRVVCGLISPHAGTVSLGGLDPERDRREYQSRIGYVPAGNGALYARLSVVENLAFWAGLALLPRARRDQAVERSVARFGLQELASRRVDRLSMGQRQRVRLAAAFLHEPELVLLDEPHTSLDSDGIDVLRAALHEVRDRGGSVIWCSPTPDDSMDFDRALEVRDGLVAQAAEAVEA
jgi:ABC-2 type transport system ATP-binding protein